MINMSGNLWNRLRNACHWNLFGQITATESQENGLQIGHILKIISNFNKYSSACGALGYTLWKPPRISPGTSQHLANLLQSAQPCRANCWVAQQLLPDCLKMAIDTVTPQLAAAALIPAVEERRRGLQNHGPCLAGRTWYPQIWKIQKDCAQTCSNTKTYK